MKYREASGEGSGRGGQTGEGSRRTDHYYSFALSRSRFAPVCAEQGGFAASH
jgi:hypothetical protein